MLTKPIITRAEGKAICNVRESNTDKDLLIDALIRAATQQLETATGRFFTEQEVTEFFNSRQTLTSSYDDQGISSTGMFLRSRSSGFHLKGLNIDPDTLSVWYDLDRVYGDDTKLAAGDYSLDPDTGILRVFCGTYERERAIKITYTAGFTPQPDDNVTEEDGTTHPLTLSDTAPSFLSEACQLQVAYLYNRRRTDNVGLTGDRSHGKADQYVQTITWGSKMGLCPEANGLVQSLKKPVMGRY